MKFLNNKSIALYILAIFFLHSYATASVNTYPTDGWQISTPEAQGLHSKSLLEMMAHIKKNGHNIQSISIVRNGIIKHGSR